MERATRNENTKPGLGNGSDPPPGQGMPRNLLVPWILLLLKQWEAHGYLLLQNLQRMGFPTIDHATLYRELRNLEGQGYVSSSWSTDGSGPAKRIYAITDAGEEMLRSGADAAAAYQRMITGFFDLYGDLMGLPRKDMKKSEGKKTKGG